MDIEINIADKSEFVFLDKCLENVLELINKLTTGNQHQPEKIVLNSVFQELLDNIKVLRNNCSKGIHYQNYIIFLPNLFDILTLSWSRDHKIYTILDSQQIESIKLLLWQLLANLCVNNTNTQNIIWTEFNSTLISCLNNEISPITDIQLMILYNLTRTNNNFLQTNEIFNLVIKVWSNYLDMKNNNINLEFLHIFFEDFLCSSGSSQRITPLYGPLDPEKRILVLKYICAYIRNGNPNNKIQKSLMEYLSKEFKKKSDCILKTNSSYINEIYPKEVIALLDVIAIATGDETYANIYYTDQSLFLNVGGLLQTLNEIGQNSENIFTPMEKLIDVAPNSETSILNKNIENEISYQLRTQLVRTLANLLYKNPKNQEYVREMKIIVAILNCTRIDARNPMLKEWSILAVRNLCEYCPENQEIITKLSKVNDVPNDILSELNLEMGSLRIKPDA